ncbi:cytochrome c [Chitinophaga sp. MM2321]|uniref:cytochrome c n=1 Tax=Chitinophaga sp. MM2321 TaxID=3137178 RepID=UPI0032D59218
MFSKILKWAGIVVLGLIVVLVIAFGVFSFLFNQHANKQYAIDVREIEIPTDSATIAAGAHLFTIKGCAHCHGTDLGGKVFVDDPPIGRFAGSNLTYGKGGLPASFDNKAWLTAMRHGVSPAGKTLMLMPSPDFVKLSDQDIGAIIAYCKAQPKVDRPTIPFKVGPMGKVLSVLGKVPLFPAEEIDHTYKQPADVVKSATAEYGEYLSVSCIGCHKPSLKGGDNPIPGGVPVANITSTGHVGKWSEDGFITALRTGKTPEGKQLKNEDMPWGMTAQYTDVELKALYLYLKNL